MRNPRSLIAAIAVAISLTFTGCQMPRLTEDSRQVQKESAESVAQKLSIIVKSAFSTMPTNATSGSISISVDSDEEASLETNALSLMWTKMTIGTKLILAGLGLGLIFIVCRAIWKSIKTTSFGQAVSFADSTLSRRIRRLREDAMQNPTGAVGIMSEIADLEAERGKMRAGNI